jgi:sulfatase modifying factor 1
MACFAHRTTLLAGAIATGALACRTPTQVTVEITTDLECNEEPDTTVQVGRIGPDLEARPVSIATRACTNGRIGSFVVVPSGDPGDEFAVKVTLGHAGRTAAGCRSDENDPATHLPGCIFARRGLHYLAHTELTLPIAMRADCDGMVCPDQSTTCVHGSCVRAIIPDPGTCRSGCDDSKLAQGDAGSIVSDSGFTDADAVGSAAPDADASEIVTSEGGPPDADASDGVASETGAPGVPPSCATPLVCGAAGDSCCESPLVTGDSFSRQNMMSLPAKVSSFRLDKYETTVGRFRAFVTAVVSSGWSPPEGSGKHVHLARGGLYSIKELALEKGWDPAWNKSLPQGTGALGTDAWNNHLGCMGASWTPTPGGNERQPIVCVNWYDAYAFCIWDGGFLPSYAEWNFAMEGGSEKRLYPWGNTPPDLNHAQYCPGFDCMTRIDVGFKVPGNGRYGQSDLAGNVWEMVLDASPPTTGDFCDDCVVFDAGSDQHATLGGGFDSQDATLGSDFVSSDFVDYGDWSNGFRCARPP